MGSEGRAGTASGVTPYHTRLTNRPEVSRVRRWLTLCVASMLAAGLAWADAGIRFEDGWIREAPPNARVLAGYGRLANAGSTPLVIVGASGEDFDRVEIHEMSMDAGVMKMRALEQVIVKPGETFEFKPGATHLMLFAPKRPLRAGDSSVVRLRTPDQAGIDVRLEVVRRD